MKKQIKTNKVNKDIKKHLKQIFFISIGVLLLDIGYYFFLSPANIVSGGVTGISIILKPVLLKFHLEQSYFLYFAEILCLILSLIFIGKDFFLKTIFASILSPTIVFILEFILPQDLILKTVENKLLVAFLCGSFLSGVGIGLCIKNNGSTGGMDVIQKILSKYLHVPFAFTLYFTDFIIVLLSGFTYSPLSYNFEIVLFGALSVFLTSYIIDFILSGCLVRRTAYIITNKPDEIKELIYNKIGRGVSVSEITGMYTNDKKKMLICVMNKNESYLLKNLIKEIDEDAFAFFTDTKEVLGDYDRKPFKKL